MVISLKATALHDEKGAYRHREGEHIDTRQSRSAELTYDDRMATTKQNKGLPQQPLIAQYYVNLSANFLKLPLTEPSRSVYLSGGLTSATETGLLPTA